ncbi:MAG: hypothetical protein S4CHLAM6_07180 [Chlamydiae bacterium]|nr:hypothetical protein [Chlamydiota bacterium]
MSFSLFAFSLQLVNAEGLDTEALDRQTEIQELEKSISALLKWQNQYRKKQKSYEAHSKRVLFRNSSPKDSKKSNQMAAEAKENVLELQKQIDMLESRKMGLIEAQL